MTLQPGGPAPYTTAIAATTVLDAFRDRGLGIPITADVLIRAGVPETLGNRSLNTFKTLGLIGDDGRPSDQLEAFRQARGDDEYHARLQEWLQGTYADVLQYADPSSDSYERVTEAFRTYEPAGQRRSMASLLIGLWKYAGLPVVATPTNGSAPPERRSRPTRPARQAAATKPKRIDPPAAAGLDQLPPGLVGLLRQIPSGGRGWTQDTRDNFVRAFSAVLDFTVPIRPEGLEDLSDADIASAEEEDDG